MVPCGLALHKEKTKRDRMESQTKLDLNSAQTLYNSEAEKAKQEQIANSKFVKLADGEQKDMTLTGNIFVSDKEFEVGKGLKKMLDFEISEKNQKGENKTFSTSARSPVAGELLKAIREMKFRVIIKRVGVGNKTTYNLIALPA
jgi:hypothetical protein